jgi:hypothetical protein
VLPFEWLRLSAVVPVAFHGLFRPHAAEA